MPEKVRKSEEQWRRELTPEQYHILREKGTERAFTGEYAHAKTPGVYACRLCGLPLFRSDVKFESGTGWPSFNAPFDKAHIRYIEDRSYGMLRTETHCSRCGSHLGHVFPDGPPPTGLRYCINGVAMEFKPD